MIYAIELLNTLIPFTSPKQHILVSVIFMVSCTAVLGNAYFLHRKKNVWKRCILVSDFLLNLLFCGYSFLSLIFKGFRLGVSGCLLSSGLISFCACALLLSLLGLAYDRYIQITLSRSDHKVLLTRSVVVISFIFAIWPLITNSFSQGVTLSPLSMFCYINFTSRESATIAYTISYALVVSNSLGATIFVHELLRRKLTKTHITQMASQRVLSTQGVLGTSSQSAPSNEDIARGLDWNILSRKNINQTQVQKDTKKWLQNFYMTVLYTIGWSPAAMYAVYELATGRQASLELYALFVLSVSITSILNSILSLYSDLSP